MKLSKSLTTILFIVVFLVSALLLAPAKLFAVLYQALPLNHNIKLGYTNSSFQGRLLSGKASNIEVYPAGTPHSAEPEWIIPLDQAQWHIPASQLISWRPHIDITATSADIDVSAYVLMLDKQQLEGRNIRIDGRLRDIVGHPALAKLKDNRLNTSLNGELRIALDSVRLSQNSLKLLSLEGNATWTGAEIELFGHTKTLGDLNFTLSGKNNHLRIVSDSRNPNMLNLNVQLLPSGLITLKGKLNTVSNTSSGSSKIQLPIDTQIQL